MRSLDTAAEFLRACPWPIHAALVRRAAIDAVGAATTTGAIDDRLAQSDGIALDEGARRGGDHALLLGEETSHLAGMTV